MKEILKNFWIFVLGVLKELDWKNVLYKVMMDTVVPKLEAKSNDTTSKIDDVIVSGIKRLVENFLGPDEKALPAPGKPA